VFTRPVLSEHHRLIMIDQHAMLDMMPDRVFASPIDTWFKQVRGLFLVQV